MARATSFTKKANVTAYESDASLYSITPRAVRQVLSVADVVEAVRFARQNEMSVTARGGGTGLAGGALGNGLIIDFGNLRSVSSIDSKNRTVLAECGIIYDELNIALKKSGLFFAPDPSSGDSCQLGGMLANNSSGPRSVKYGLTSDFVEELEIVKPSGQTAQLKKLRLGSRELDTFFKQNPEYWDVYQILWEKQELIRARWPKLKKNSAGYNLRQVVKDFEQSIFNLPALLVGSEGTLGLFITARLRLLPLPQQHLTARLYFKSLVAAGRAVPEILKLGPSGLEIVDGSTLTLIGREKFGIPAEAAALLLVEFDEDIIHCRENFDHLAQSFDLAAAVAYAVDPESAASLWRARKAIVPTLYRHHPERRPVPLIEDVSLPPEHVPDFIEYVTRLFAGHNLTYGIFGHIGDGNLHIRPLLDLNREKELELAVRLYNEVYEKVISLGGSSTAEHADGRLRAPLVKKIYGDDIYYIFQRLKRALDPENLFAPGVILSDIPFTARIDFEKIKSYCAACGKCNGYCPAYDVFRREDFSPRGWLRMINQSDEAHKELSAYLKFCLNCKNCATVCPAGVDIAAEIIKHRSLKPSNLSRLAVGFTDMEPLLNLSLRMGQMVSPLAVTRVGKWLTEMLGNGRYGLDRTAEFPPIAARSLRKRHPDRMGETGDIALFHGCADNLLVSSVGEAVFRVFDHLGLPVLMPEQRCCGLPQEVYGHHENVIAKAKFNIDHLSPFKTIITGCASCLLRLKEYPRLFSEKEAYHSRATALAEKCFDISQFLNKIDFDTSAFDFSPGIKVTYHNPCHLRAAGLHREPERLLQKFPGVEITPPMYADRCCAQAGSYGFVHFQESKRMFQKKKEEYLGIEADYLMTSCPACQMKIRAEMGKHFKTVHPIEILAARLRK